VIVESAEAIRFGQIVGTTDLAELQVAL